MKGKKQSTKNVVVELLRIIAILFVIGTHVKLPYITGENISKARIFIACFVADGVALFWIITGFYYFRNITYKERIKQLHKRIIIPLIIVSIITFYLNNYISGITNIDNSLHHTKIEYLNILINGILKWQNVIPGADHLWYLYIYIIIVLLYPILNKIKELIDKYDYKKVLFIVLILLFINDLSANNLLELSHHSINGVFTASLFLYSGYLLHKNSYIFLKKQNILKGIILFFSINTIRALLICIAIQKHPSYKTLISWHTSFALIGSFALYIFALNINNLLKNNSFLNKCIIHIGTKTMNIYLVHILVLNYLYSKSIPNYILNKFNNLKYNEIIYEILYTTIIFICSLIISEIITLIKYILRIINNNKYLKT